MRCIERESSGTIIALYRLVTKVSRPMGKIQWGRRRGNGSIAIFQQWCNFVLLLLLVLSRYQRLVLGLYSSTRLCWRISGQGSKGVFVLSKLNFETRLPSFWFVYTRPESRNSHRRKHTRHASLLPRIYISDNRLLNNISAEMAFGVERVSKCPTLSPTTVKGSTPTTQLQSSTDNTIMGKR